MIFNVDFSESKQVIGEELGIGNKALTDIAIGKHNKDPNAHAELLKGSRVKINNGDTITLADNVTYYAESEISTLTVIYPTGTYISVLEFTLASAGDITITLPQSKYISGAPTFANGETWELNIKNGVVVGGLVE